MSLKKSTLRYLQRLLNETENGGKDKGNGGNDSSNQQESALQQNLALILTICAFILLILIICVTLKFNERRYESILPEAEVKIQLALFKLEYRHHLKV